MAVLRGIALCLLVVLASACRSGPEQWGPFRGQVVDAETGVAIAGAHVMALWIREPPALHFSQWFYAAEETTTGPDGRFDIPRRTRLLTAFVVEPGISVFAPGYLMQMPEVTPSDGRPYVDPTVVRMRPLKTREERCKHRPAGPWAPGRAVPNFSKAIQEYNLQLGCYRLSGDQS